MPDKTLPLESTSLRNSIALDIRARLPCGTVQLGQHLRAAAESDAVARYALALELQEHLRKVISSGDTEPPVYNVEVARADEQYRVVHLVYLPSFFRPSRLFRLTNFGGSGNQLYLREIWLAPEPELQPLDPGRFAFEYKIRVGEFLAYRSAVIDVIKRRLCATETPRDSIRIWLSEHSENVLPAYGDDDD
jgi:hypothetical protein